MSWRTVLITKKSRLSYQNNHLVIKNEEEIKLIHLSEINTVILECPQITITVPLMSELMSNKIKLVVCDEKHNPKGELVPYYGNFHCSKMITKQIKWNMETKDYVWYKIVYEKIKNQAKVLKKHHKNNGDKLIEFLNLDCSLEDFISYEGIAAKIYFNALYGENFIRDQHEYTAALDYGYTILLSAFNREIVNQGYSTQLGIFHQNEYNYFNLSCDLMEPFRILIDEYVFNNKITELDVDSKLNLVNILNQKVKIDGKSQYVVNAISIYLRSIFKTLETGSLDEIKFFEFQ